MAVSAGYSEKTAYSMANQNLRKLDVKKAIEAGQSEIKGHLAITAGWKREQLWRLSVAASPKSSAPPIH